MTLWKFLRISSLYILAIVNIYLLFNVNETSRPVHWVEVRVWLVTVLRQVNRVNGRMDFYVTATLNCSALLTKCWMEIVLSF